MRTRVRASRRRRATHRKILGDARLLGPVAWREAVVDVQVLSGGRLDFFRRLLQAQTSPVPDRNLASPYPPQPHELNFASTEQGIYHLSKDLCMFDSKFR